MVVTLTCPSCTRELLLEVEDGPTQRMAVLTIMEGPHWVGEQFVVPVGVTLPIGSASENWLSLDDEKLSAQHCVLHLTKAGVLILEDRKSEAGTWVRQQRVARAKLPFKQSFRVGGFRLRVDLQTPDGSTITTPAQQSTPLDNSAFLPTMTAVTGKKSFGYKLIANRFILSRVLINAFAILAGLYHVFALHGKTVSPWPWNKSIITGSVILVCLVAAGRRVALAHRYLQFASLALLVVTALLDLAWSLTGGATCALAVAASLTVLLMPQAKQPLAITGAAIGAGACIAFLIVTINTVMLGLRGG
jgi:hypothetical protein